MLLPIASCSAVSGVCLSVCNGSSGPIQLPSSLRLRSPLRSQELLVERRGGLSTSFPVQRMERSKERRKSLGHPSLMERSLQKSKQEVSLSIFAFLFSEIVQYCLSSAKKGYRMEDRLHELGLRIGYKILDLLVYRERHKKREIKILSILTFISTCVWRYLFGHSGELLKAQDNELECKESILSQWLGSTRRGAYTCDSNEDMINDKQLLLNKYISIPRDMNHVNCGAYAAGIIEGILCSAEFPAAVSAHTVEESPNQKSTTFLIKFLPEVIERQKRLAGGGVLS
ncbi:trafficking protein particle complex subunit 5 [Cystoisospora suis]|uniref:Trafficking protein particle complex subunit 5 n=1 Tax=Cystoisospora suis TaxID=483139 RepID=A0A2C6LBM6_9APIC|nr:trafficking protein particle complex subunit 5 [Cystoisospora suis]